MRSTGSTGSSTPDTLLDTAERLFATHGIAAVSNRKVAEEAGAANNSAVHYHFGSKVDLLRAIVSRHRDATERIARRMLDDATGSADPRDYISCLILPTTEHLASIGVPTWYARFMLQAKTEPAAREAGIDVMSATPCQQEAIDHLTATITGIAQRTTKLRGDLVEAMLINAYARYEKELAAGQHPTTEWIRVGQFLRDAATGLLLAPDTTALSDADGDGWEGS